MQTLKTSRSEAPDCTGGSPPECCELTLDAMLEMEDGDGTPCPECGSRVTMPTLLAPGEMQCWERECSAIWTVER